MEFHKLKIKEIIKEAKDAVVVEFDVSSKLEEKFRFLPGQYLTLKHVLNGKELRRAYSICSTPRSGQLKVGIKKVENGLFSNFAYNELKIGDELEVAKPQGKFTVTCKSNNEKTYVLVAGGSGITPILSMFKTILSEEPFSKIYLFYGNQSPETMMFKDDIEKFASIYPSKFMVYNKFSRVSEIDVNYGRLSGEFIANTIGKDSISKIDAFYLCGPEELIHSSKEYLENSYKVDSFKINVELFTAAKSKKTDVLTEDFTESLVTVLISGKKHLVKVPKGEKILDVIIDQNIDVPYSCQGGFCTQCQCKVMHGKVEMAQNLALSDQEISEGQTLTCQSIPKTSEVMLVFED